jgi:hypothetical protein
MSFVFPSSYVPDLGDFRVDFSVFFGLGCIASAPPPHTSVFVGLTPTVVVFVCPRLQFICRALCQVHFIAVVT